MVVHIQQLFNEIEENVKKGLFHFLHLNQSAPHYFLVISMSFSMHYPLFFLFRFGRMGRAFANI